MIDASTAIPLGIAVPLGLWLGTKIIAATKAAQSLTSEIHQLRSALDHKLDRRDFEQWMERLGYKNPELRVPPVPEKDKEAA